MSEQKGLYTKYRELTVGFENQVKETRSGISKPFSGKD